MRAFALFFTLLLPCLPAVAAPTAAAPMLSGDDTRNLAHAPAFVNFSPVTVHPGERGTVAFDVFNYYPETIRSAQVTLNFHVGGNWLDARDVERNFSNPPKFDRSVPFNPVDIAPGASMHVSQNFTTSPGTPGGPYIVSVVLTFTYSSPSNVPTTAVFKSLGSLKANERDKVNMSDFNGTLNALGIDGVAPDTSIVVDSGEAMALYLAAVGFGVAVVAVGTAIGLYRSRRGRPHRRKPA
jgi:hypothetical protein